MSTMSNCCSSTAFTASKPFSTALYEAPRPVSMLSTSSWFTGLSSAINTRRPLSCCAVSGLVSDSKLLNASRSVAPVTGLCMKSQVLVAISGLSLRISVSSSRWSNLSWSANALRVSVSLISSTTTATVSRGASSGWLIRSVSKPRRKA